MPIEAPKDRPYPGEIQLTVNATDLERRIVHVHESLSAIGAETVLLYPKWLPGTHAPEGPIDKVAGIRITAKGTPVAWTRDPGDVYAFRVHAGPGITSIDVDFDYLSATSPQNGAEEISRDLIMLEWNELVLYPAGYFTRQIMVKASLTLPADWQFATALETASTGGAGAAFKRVSLESLVDSPVYAGRYSARLAHPDSAANLAAPAGAGSGRARVFLATLPDA